MRHRWSAGKERMELRSRTFSAGKHMAKISRLSFLPLCGGPPSDLEIELDRLPDSNDVFSLVRSAFEPFCDEGVEAETVVTLRRLISPADGLHLVYAYGHAWLDGGALKMTIGSRGPSAVIDGSEFIATVLNGTAPDRTILILDCCHAAAFDAVIQAPQPVPRLAIYGCGADENAIALRGDNASRLSLVLHRKLRSDFETVDLTGVIIDVARELLKDGVIPGQEVSYRMNGPGVVLSSVGTRTIRRRERTVSLVRNAFLATGALVAIVLGVLGWFYWDHTLIDLGIGDLKSISASNLTLLVLREEPDSNRSDAIATKILEGQQIRMWVPARDIILRVNGSYRDHAERGLSYPLVLRPGFSYSTKLLHLELPSVAEIEAHPNMAYVPPTHWIHGRELEQRVQGNSFWIDLRPPTVQQYIPIARTLMQSGGLKAENSFLLTSSERSAGLDSTGLGQVRTLNQNLGAIFGVIASGTSQQVSAPGDIVVGAGKIPCPTCPAPMTRFEAGLYCSSQKKRLPTDLEWELAARGVDGRVYPWGNQFDDKRANVPGLPQKGEPPPTLKPVDAYPGEVSPFGLVDTVGNAGDWVTNESSSYERVYMGATYRYNPEDATTFRMLPVTDSDYLFQEITARCVSDSGPRP
jgi:Sulfatase-modifying factor enzyme 1